MKRFFMAFALLTALSSLTFVQPAAFASSEAIPAPVAAATSVPVNFSNAAGSFAGYFDITRFAVQNGQIVAVGTLTGLVTLAGGVAQAINPQQLTIPVLLGPGGTTGSCEILNLVLGPLDLNLLGLVIHLDRVELNISAEPGPGNLLGNLLCAIAGLLDGGGTLQGLVGLLNNLLRILG